MPGEIDQISMQLGRLLEANEAAARHRRLVMEKLEELSEKIASVPELADRVTKIEPEIEKLKRSKWIGLGIFTGLGLTTGGLGGALADKLAALFGGGH